MKTLLKITLLSVCSILLISASCKKEKTGLAALPAATQEGKNTFGCLIDGNVFVAQTHLFNKSPVTCEYGYIDSDISKGHFFQASGLDDKSNPDKFFSVKIFTSKIDIKEGTTYPFQNQKDNGAFAEYIINIYNKYTSLSGELTITKFDEINHIASGTFWFDAQNDKGEKVEVREGRFDAKIL